MSEMKNVWREKWNSKLHHELTLSEFVGPFPVGPVGYRRKMAEMIANTSGDGAKSAMKRHKVIPNPHRPEFIFCGDVRHGAVYVLDARTEEGLGRLDGGALGVIPTRRGEGIPEEMYWLVSEGRRGGNPAVRHTMDYSIGGFNARVRGHALILNRLEDKTLIPDEVMQDYVLHEEGLLTLARPYTPEAHNAFWGVSYDPRAVELEDVSPSL